MLGKHLAARNARNSSFWSFKTGLNETPRQHKKDRRRASRGAIQEASSAPSLSTQPNRTEETWPHFTRGDLSERAALWTLRGGASRGRPAPLTPNENPPNPNSDPARSAAAAARRRCRPRRRGPAGQRAAGRGRKRPPPARALANGRRAAAGGGGRAAPARSGAGPGGAACDALR